MGNTLYVKNQAGYTNRYSHGCWAGAVMWRAGVVGGAEYMTAAEEEKIYKEEDKLLN